ncbi:response regulator [Candidatus Poribacteria bacterium]|nr:response regulator [Candidatus Poribacteria bacterium]
MRNYNMKSSLRILIADDQPIVNKTLISYIKDLDHQVDKAYDAATALEIIKSNKYDLTIIDLHIPGAKGLSIIGKIQQLKPEMPIVVITCNGNINMAVESLRLGATDFLTKPIRMLELEGVLIKSARLSKLHSQQTQNIKKLENECDALKARISKLTMQLKK